MLIRRQNHHIRSILLKIEKLMMARIEPKKQRERNSLYLLKQQTSAGVGKSTTTVAEGGMEVQPREGTQVDEQQLASKKSKC